MTPRTCPDKEKRRIRAMLVPMPFRRGLYVDANAVSQELTALSDISLDLLRLPIRIMVGFHFRRSTNFRHDSMRQPE
jgi:hypothetical protein